MAEDYYLDQKRQYWLFDPTLDPIPSGQCLEETDLWVVVDRLSDLVFGSIVQSTKAFVSARNDHPIFRLTPSRVVSALITELTKKLTEKLAGVEREKDRRKFRLSYNVNGTNYYFKINRGMFSDQECYRESYSEEEFNVAVNKITKDSGGPEVDFFFIWLSDVSSRVDLWACSPRRELPDEVPGMSMCQYDIDEPALRWGWARPLRTTAIDGSESENISMPTVEILEEEFHIEFDGDVVTIPFDSLEFDLGEGNQ